MIKGDNFISEPGAYASGLFRLRKVIKPDDFLQWMTEEKKLTTKEVAEKLEASRATINLWCRKGRFPNAKKETDTYGNEYWLIPESNLQGVEIKMGRPKKKDK